MIQITIICQFTNCLWTTRPYCHRWPYLHVRELNFSVAWFPFILSPHCPTYSLLSSLRQIILITINLRKTNTSMKRSAQRRRKHCALAVVRRSQKISPHRRPLPGGAGRPKFNQLQTFTYKPSLVRIDARNFELSW